jgi:hypothetical protein
MRRLVWQVERRGVRRLAFIEDIGDNHFELLIVDGDGHEVRRTRFRSRALAEDRAALEYGRLISQGWAERNDAS